MAARRPGRSLYVCKGCHQSWEVYYTELEPARSAQTHLVQVVPDYIREKYPGIFEYFGVTTVLGMLEAVSAGTKVYVLANTGQEHRPRWRFWRTR